MKKFYLTLFMYLFVVSENQFAQIENVPLNNPVYTFLKEMKVKRILPYISEDMPNLSRFQVIDFLEQIRDITDELSSTEKELLQWYEIEFSESVDPDTANYFWQPGKSFGKSLEDIFSDKEKYFHAYKEENANFYFEFLGHLYFGQTFKPEKKSASLFDAGFRMRGTVFNHLGYNLTVFKGGSSGSTEVAELMDPRLTTSFKWIENAENIGNYDFTTGYVKYYTEAAEDLHISLQLGREHKTVGYGYGSKLVLSGDNPPMDFLQFNFDYGIVHLSSIFASTVGEFSFDPDERFTKYWAFNRLKITLKDLFDIGIGESIVYSGRGLELGYATPAGFYKFVEHSIQDRDNANLYFDIQTNFIDNFEIQGTFFLDENILSNLQDLDKYSNKTAYQLGFFWYQPFSFENFSLIFEYTKIRPFVYTHTNYMNTYTAFSKNLGHRIGPNADEIFAKIAYNFSEKIRLNFGYIHQREGNNVYDDQGNLVKNVGGDIYLSHGSSPENEEAIFLDGVRVDNDILETMLRVQPIRGFIFDFIYNYTIEKNITNGFNNYYSYGYIRFTLEY